METKAEDESSPEKVELLLGAQAPEEEVEGKGEEEGGHDGAETDARKIDGPVGSSDHEGGGKTCTGAVEKLPAEKKKAENGESAEEDGAEFERDHRVAEEPDGECLEIDEETFAAVIRRIEEFETVRLKRMESINTIGRLVGVEADRDGFEMRDAKQEGEEKECDERESERKVRPRGLPHKEMSKKISEPFRRSISFLFFNLIMVVLY